MTATAAPTTKWGAQSSTRTLFSSPVCSTTTEHVLFLRSGLERVRTRACTHISSCLTLTMESFRIPSCHGSKATSHSPMSSQGAVIKHFVSSESSSKTTPRSNRLLSTSGNSSRQSLYFGLPTTTLSPSGMLLRSGRLARCSKAPRHGATEIVKRWMRYWSESSTRAAKGIHDMLAAGSATNTNLEAPWIESSMDPMQML